MTHTTLKKDLLKKPGIYLVMDKPSLKGRDIESIVSRSLEAGVDIIQFRDKEAPSQEFLDTGNRIKNLLKGKDVLFIVNDRVDLAFLLESDGVHLGRDDMSVEEAREILGKEKMIGLSTHSALEMREAIKKDVDYISVGPVFATPMKPGYKAVGLEPIRIAAKEIKIPFVAIGGIDKSNIDDVVAAGAKRVAVIRAILSSEDPFKAAKDLIERLGHK